MTNRCTSWARFCGKVHDYICVVLLLAVVALLHQIALAIVVGLHATRGGLTELPRVIHNPDPAEFDPENASENLLMHQQWRTSDLSTYTLGDELAVQWKKFAAANRIRYKLWTDEEITPLVQKTDHWPTYEGLSRIQRADYSRLLLVYLDGGLYADLDTHPGHNAACTQSIWALLQTSSDIECILPLTDELSLVSNHFFACRRTSGFLKFAMEFIVERRESWLTSRIWLVNYLDVFWNTGPVCFTDAFRAYMHTRPSSGQMVLLSGKVLRDWVLHKAGRSWHGDLEKFFMGVSEICVSVGTCLTEVVLPLGAWPIVGLLIVCIFWYQLRRGLRRCEERPTRPNPDLIELDLMRVDS